MKRAIPRPRTRTNQGGNGGGAGPRLNSAVSSGAILVGLNGVALTINILHMDGGYAISFGGRMVSEASGAPIASFSHPRILLLDEEAWR